MTTAGNYVNISIDKVVPICCRGDATITVQAIPSVLIGATLPNVPTDTQVPILQSVNLTITKLF